MCDININYAQQGWQCPICKRVYSPTTPMCFYCGQESKTVTTTDFTFVADKPIIPDEIIKVE